MPIPIRFAVDATYRSADRALAVGIHSPGKVSDMESRFAVDAGFRGALDQMAQDLALADGRFPARNFLLECEVPSSRVVDYINSSPTRVSGSSGASVLGQFNAHHNRYLSRSIRLGVRSRKFDAMALDCPASFKAGAQTKEYGGAAPELELVRLEDIRFIAHSGLWDVDEAARLLTAVADANRNGVHLSANQESESRALLDAWQDTVDARPLFAAFWEEVYESSDWNSRGWANILRDRMGLAHLDASTRGPIPSVLFKYPVALVPESHSGPRLLLRPTVLDCSLSEAFYTGEPESGVGSTVDLMVRDDDPWQEVIHPAVRFGAGHVWAVDVITSGIPAAISDAREHHMLKVAISATPEYAMLCELIDGDL